MMVHINYLSVQLRMDKSELCQLLKSLSVAMADQDFIRQVLEINDQITEMSADNWAMRPETDIATSTV